MPAVNPVHAFAETTSALVMEHDLAGTLSNLLASCAALNAVQACGLLVADGGAGLQLLAATSHRASELELYQAQISEGPCVDAWSSGNPVVAAGADAIIGRWNRFGRKVIEAGFESVGAMPLRWRNASIGALNLFRQSASPLADDELMAAQVFADLTTVLIVHTEDIAADSGSQRARAALASRTVVEQAKGVIGHQLQIDMAAAYEELKALAVRSGRNLTDTANRVIREAYQR